MSIKLETWIPVHQERLVPTSELDSVYRAVPITASPTFTWNDLGEDVLIVSLGVDYCTVSRCTDETWYYLWESDDESEVEVLLAGQPAFIPKGAVLRQEVGLEVLAKAEKCINIDSYNWREQ